MASEGRSVQLACRVLGVAESGYYEWRSRPVSARALRHAWLTEQIQAIHTASFGTYGARRVHAELRLGHGILVGHGAVEMLMRRAGLAGLPGRKRRRAVHDTAFSADLVDRNFTRPAPNQLWVTDITEHPTREGKVYCAVVLDVHSRRVVGWSIDSSQTAALATNALSMAISNRSPLPPGTLIHSDHGVQFTSWAFTRRAKESGLVPSMGSVGDCYDNAVIESFWGRVQTELLDRRRWRTRIELANALFEYIEMFHNRRRRHSALGMLTPIEYEKLHTPATA
ncbi:MAG: transposase [Pseudonocardia sp. SCN 72-86]|nr:MAG: transposase [Pseudonocardia sp. SCN 72-86]